MEVYKQTTIANLEREVEILRKKVEVSQAQDLVAQVDMSRRVQLESKGILTQRAGLMPRGQPGLRPAARSKSAT